MSDLEGQQRVQARGGRKWLELGGWQKQWMWITPCSASTRGLEVEVAASEPPLKV